MKTLLVVNSSGRVTRSITRRLTARFSSAWLRQHPGGDVIDRDVGANPPPTVNEAWIAAAFSPPARRSPEMREALRTSDTLIDELVRADTIVLGAPLYNFGMPAALKAYIDQIVRVGRTFAFEAGAAEPYRPLLPPKPVIVVTAAGDGALMAGGALANLNHLEPHLATVLGFIGLKQLTFVRVGFEEFQDERLQRAIAAAEAQLDALARDEARPDVAPDAPLFTTAA